MSHCDCNEAEGVAGARVPTVLHVVNVHADHELDEIDDVAVVDAPNVTLTLPPQAAPGKSIRVLATNGAVKVEGGCHDIAGVATGGHAVVPANRSVDFTFSGGCDGVWVGSTAVGVAV